jgi:hypothetical protein
MDAWSDVLVPQGQGATLRDAALAPEDQNLSRWGNFLAAIQELGLNQQEQNLYRHHLNNMAATGGLGVPNKQEGGRSTVLQANVRGPGGRYYDVPTVWDGKILPPMEGVRKAVASQGWDYWPSYATSDEADARYMQYHQYMEKDAPEFWTGLGEK